MRPEIAPMVLGTAGHIDHGKTSLVRALTGMETDTLKDEVRRGMTIDLGFAHMDVEGQSGEPLRVAIVDVPGHERFIRNMLAGVAGIDAVLFVVAADDGIMPQTIEHFDIVSLLGVQRGVFAITKCDLVSSERVKKVVFDVCALKAGTPLESAEVLPISVITGEGLEVLKSCLVALASARWQRKYSHLFRLPIDRAFSIKGHGAVVTGTVVGGSAERGEELFIFPTGEKARLRSIQCMHRDEAMSSAGSRYALNLSGVSHVGIRRGHVVAAQSLKSFATRHGKSRFVLRCSFDLLVDRRGGSYDIRRGATYKVHHLTGDSTARVFLDRDIADSDSRRKLYGRLVLTEPLLMLRGDRFIVRDPSTNRTIGAGTVLLPHIAGHELVRYSDIVPDDGLECALAKVLSVLFCVDLDELTVLLNVSTDDLSALIDNNTRFSRLVCGVALKERIEAQKGRVLDILRDYHSQHSGESGMREDALIVALEPTDKRGDKKARASFIKAILDDMIAVRLLKREGAALSLVSFAPALLGPDAIIERAILALMPAIGAIKACDVGQLAGLAHKKADVDRVLAYLLRSKSIVRVAKGVFVSGVQVNEAIALLKAHFISNRTIRASEFRDTLGCGRKLAIELLEYFDAERITLRKGDERVLRSSEGSKP